MFYHLNQYLKQDFISFHTPAHQGRNPYVNRILKGKFDLTELTETDNLFEPTGIIAALEERIAKAFGSKKAFILVNGATSGIMSVFSLFCEKDKIIMDRNSHISAINGLTLSGAVPLFIKPKLNEYNIPCPPAVSEVEELLKENPDCKAVFITSPNYYGLKADICAISKLAKKRGVLLIVDEAHGAHQYFLKDTKTAISSGADVSILSFHKNLPSLTQTGAIAVNSNQIDLNKLKYCLRNFTSTSPSYLFMLAIDGMIDYMDDEGKRQLEKITKEAENLKKALLLKNIQVLENQDPTRLVIHTNKAEEVEKNLKEYFKIIPEMTDRENVVFIISMHHKKIELRRLYDGLSRFASSTKTLKKEFTLPKRVLTPKEAISKPKKEVNISDCKNKICGECIIQFPPSVPIILYGELIDEKMQEILRKELKRTKIIILDWE